MDKIRITILIISWITLQETQSTPTFIQPLGSPQPTPESHISDFRYQKRSDSRADLQDSSFPDTNASDDDIFPPLATTSRIKTRRELYTELIGTVLRNFRFGITSAVNLGQQRLQNLNELRQKRRFEFNDDVAVAPLGGGGGRSDKNRMALERAPNNKRLSSLSTMGRNYDVEDNNNKKRMLQRLSETTAASASAVYEDGSIDATKENQNETTSTRTAHNSTVGLKLNGDGMDNDDERYNYNGQNNQFGTSPDDGVASAVPEDDDVVAGDTVSNGGAAEGFGADNNLVNKEIIVSTILTALGLVPRATGGSNSGVEHALFSGIGANKTHPDPAMVLRNLRNFIIQRKVNKLTRFVITPFLESLSRAQLNATTERSDVMTGTTPDDYDRDFEESVSNPELSAFTSSASARNLDSYGIMVLEFFGTIFGLAWGLASQLQGAMMPEE